MYTHKNIHTYAHTHISGCRLPEFLMGMGIALRLREQHVYWKIENKDSTDPLPGACVHMRPFMYVYVCTILKCCVCVYIYIYIYIHTHTEFYT